MGGKDSNQCLLAALSQWNEKIRVQLLVVGMKAQRAILHTLVLYK